MSVPKSKYSSKKVDSLTSVDYSDMTFPMIVVYRHPADFPDRIVARVWEGARNIPMDLYCDYKTLDECRADALAAGFTERINRNPLDDIVIVESYMR